MITENEKKVEYSSINDLYDTTALADALGVSKEMIYYYKRNGKLEGFKVSKNKDLYSKPQVVELLKNIGYTINGENNEN